MSHTTQSDWFEKEVRTRSYAVWEREGRKDGRAERHWGRAVDEIAAECRAAIAGTSLQFTPAHLVVSQRPTRH